MSEGGARSAAAAAASRRNGARSKGPRSAGGKAASAQNARKHGLFSALDWDAETASPAIRELVTAIEGLAAGRGQAWAAIDTIVSAALRLEQAAMIVHQLSAELDWILAHEVLDSDALAALIEELVRAGRYERRFRGRRDRGLRALLTLPAADQA